MSPNDSLVARGGGSRQVRLEIYWTETGRHGLKTSSSGRRKWSFGIQDWRPEGRKSRSRRQRARLRSIGQVIVWRGAVGGDIMTNSSPFAPVVLPLTVLDETWAAVGVRLMSPPRASERRRQCTSCFRAFCRLWAVLGTTRGGSDL